MAHSTQPTLNSTKTTLHQAVLDRNIVLVRELILVSDPKEKDSLALSNAVKLGYTDIVEVLAPVSDITVRKGTNLITASDFGFWDIVELLAPACVAAKQTRAVYLTIQNAIFQNNIAIVQLLMPALQTLPNTENQHIQLLQDAILEKRLDIVKILIPHCQTKCSIRDFNDALVWAVEEEYMDIALEIVPFADYKHVSISSGYEQNNLLTVISNHESLQQKMVLTKAVSDNTSEHKSMGKRKI